MSHLPRFYNTCLRFIPGCSGQVQTPASSWITNGCPNVGRNPPPLLPRNSYKYFVRPPFFAQIIHLQGTLLKIIHTTLSFWRRQSLLSKRAISHLPPQNSGAVEFATRGNPSCPRHKERLTPRVCLRLALNNSPNPGRMHPPPSRTGAAYAPKICPGCSHSCTRKCTPHLLDPGARTPP